MRFETTFLPPRTSTTSSTGISTRPILSCRLKAATRLSRLSLTFFSKPEYVWMMYHCIPIDLWFPSDAELFKDIANTVLHQPVDHREKNAKERNGGDNHEGRRNNIVAARPGDLFHFDTNVMKKLTRVRNGATDFLTDTGSRSGNCVALFFFVL